MDTPAEKEMRTQMFRTMQALERACDAITSHLAAPAPPPRATPEELAELRKRVGNGATCDHPDLQSQCTVCAKWVNLHL